MASAGFSSGIDDFLFLARSRVLAHRAHPPRANPLTRTGLYSLARSPSHQRRCLGPGG